VLRIKEIRTERGLTQRELAAISGVTIATIQNLESGRHQASTVTLLGIARGLDISMDELFSKASS
jgi:putative transcriptional regulator